MITLISTYNSILQSLDQFKITAVGLILAVVVKAAINSLMIRHFGMIGASWATVISLLVALGIILWALPSGVKNLFFDGEGFVHKLCLAVLMMGLSVGIVVHGLRMVIFLSRKGSIVITVIGMLVGAAVFLSMVIGQKMFTTREWLMIPGGKKLLLVLEKIAKRGNSK